MQNKEIHIESSTGICHSFSGSATFEEVKKNPLVDYILHWSVRGDRILIYAHPVGDTERVVWKSIPFESAPQHIQLICTLFP